jgi:hypothetical protein
MLLAASVAVVAALVGYLRSGGGEELFRQVLAQLTARFTQGSAHFQSLEFGLGSVTVSDLSLQLDDNAQGAGYRSEDVVLRGLKVAKATMQWDIRHWPPTAAAVQFLELEGFKDLTIEVLHEEYLQRTVELPSAIPFPIRFKNVNLTLKIGRCAPLVLEECSGEFRAGRDDALGGSFHLKKLNGRDFDFRLEALADGRWLFTGRNLDVDTRRVLTGERPKKLDEKPFDPLTLLLSALFSGDCAAKGRIERLQIEVRPATKDRAFSCSGEIAYGDLRVSLPREEAPAGSAVPDLLSKLFGAEDAAGGGFWPGRLAVDEIHAAPKSCGRLWFHMADERLTFACDGGAFHARKGKVAYPPLEALQGALETDDERRLKRIELRGFWGDDYRFEIYVRRRPDAQRDFELSVEPRAETQEGLRFDTPLWRFRSHVETLPPGDADAPSMRFHVEAAATRFPFPDRLPTGLIDLGGRFTLSGDYVAAKQELRLRQLRMRDGFLVCGRSSEQTATRPKLGVFWESLLATFAADEEPWRLRDLELTGQLTVRLDERGAPRSVNVESVLVESGRLLRRGLVTNWTGKNIELRGEVMPAETPDAYCVKFLFGVPEQWVIHWNGCWSEQDGGASEFSLVEQGVPIDLHPDRDKLKRLLRDTAKPRTIVVRGVAGRFAREERE